MQHKAAPLKMQVNQQGVEPVNKPKQEMRPLVVVVITYIPAVPNAGVPSCFSGVTCAVVVRADVL